MYYLQWAFMQKIGAVPIIVSVICINANANAIDQCERAPSVITVSDIYLVGIAVNMVGISISSSSSNEGERNIRPLSFDVNLLTTGLESLELAGSCAELGLNTNIQYIVCFSENRLFTIICRSQILCLYT